MTASNLSPLRESSIPLCNSLGRGYNRGTPAFQYVLPKLDLLTIPLRFASGRLLFLQYGRQPADSANMQACAIYDIIIYTDVWFHTSTARTDRGVKITCSWVCGLRSACFPVGPPPVGVPEEESWTWPSITVSG